MWENRFELHTRPMVFRGGGSALMQKKESSHDRKMQWETKIQKEEGEKRRSHVEIFCHIVEASENLPPNRPH